MKRDPIKTLKNKALRLWKLAVKKKYNNQCVQCGDTKMLNAHHIQSSKMWPEMRYELESGLSLCPKCHKFGRRAVHNSFLNTYWLVSDEQMKAIVRIYYKYEHKNIKFELTEKYIKNKIIELEEYLHEGKGIDN